MAVAHAPAATSPGAGPPGAGPPGAGPLMTVDVPDLQSVIGAFIPEQAGSTTDAPAGAEDAGDSDWRRLPNVRDALLRFGAGARLSVFPASSPREARPWLLALETRDPDEASQWFDETIRQLQRVAATSATWPIGETRVHAFMFEPPRAGSTEVDTPWELAAMLRTARPLATVGGWRDQLTSFDPFAAPLALAYVDGALLASRDAGLLRRELSATSSVAREARGEDYLVGLAMDLPALVRAALDAGGPAEQELVARLGLTALGPLAARMQRDSGAVTVDISVEVARADGRGLGLLLAEERGEEAPSTVAWPPTPGGDPGWRLTLNVAPEVLQTLTQTLLLDGRRVAPVWRRQLVAPTATNQIDLWEALPPLLAAPITVTNREDVHAISVGVADTAGLVRLFTRLGATPEVEGDRRRYQVGPFGAVLHAGRLHIGVGGDAGPRPLLDVEETAVDTDVIAVFRSSDLTAVAYGVGRTLHVRIVFRADH